jgi:outer membrane lipoprotein-sorting protein
MKHNPRLGRRARWAVPGGAVLAVGAVVAGATVAGAQTAPSLPARSAAQLLVAVQQASGPGPMTATVQETANLGLPDLPGSDSASSALSLLAGSHTFMIWYADPTHVRVAEPVQLGETDLRRDGRQVWLWDSTTQTATHVLPAPRTPVGLKAMTGAATGSGSGSNVFVGVAGIGKIAVRKIVVEKIAATKIAATKISAAQMAARRAAVQKAVRKMALRQKAIEKAATTPAPTPQQVARQILAAIGPTTTVSVQRNVMVAGQAAYQIALAPKDSRSLIGQVRIAIDASRSFPLRVQVFARGATSPAFQIGFTALSFGRPAASNFSFTPPPGAKIKTITAPARPLLPMAGQHVVRAKFFVVPGKGGKPAKRFMIRGQRGSLFAKPSSAQYAYSSAPVSVYPGLGQPLGGLSGATVMGKGWLSVLVLPSSGIPSAAVTISPASGAPVRHGPAGPTAGLFGVLMHAATPVHGAWGSGRLLRTSLVSVLITSKGTVFAGAVTPSVLYADAATAAK